MHPLGTYYIVKEAIDKHLEFESAEGIIGEQPVYTYKSNEPAMQLALDISCEICDKIAEEAAKKMEYAHIADVIQDVLEKNSILREVRPIIRHEIVEFEGTREDIACVAASEVARVLEEERLYGHDDFIPIPQVIRKEIHVPDIVLNRTPIGKVADICCQSITERFNNELFNKLCGPATTNGWKQQRVHPVKVWFNPPYTTVEFSDGDKVTVEQQNFEDQRFDEYVGFCCAVTKKFFGNATGAIEAFEEAKRTAYNRSPKARRERENVERKTYKQMKHEARVKEREEMIKEKADELRIQREAEKRLKEEE